MARPRHLPGPNRGSCYGSLFGQSHARFQHQVAIERKRALSATSAFRDAMVRCRCRDGRRAQGGPFLALARQFLALARQKWTSRRPPSIPTSATDHRVSRSGDRRTSSALALDRARVSRQPLSQAAIRYDNVDDSNFILPGSATRGLPHR